MTRRLFAVTRERERLEGPVELTFRNFFLAYILTPRDHGKDQRSFESADWDQESDCDIWPWTEAYKAHSAIRIGLIC